MPFGAVVAHGKAATVLQPGNHGSTFGGNPLAMRAGIETIRIMEEDGLLAHATKVGDRLKSTLQKELADVKGVVDVRGQGLIIGIELNKPCGALLGRGAEAGQRCPADQPGAARPQPGRSRGRRARSAA